MMLNHLQARQKRTGSRLWERVFAATVIVIALSGATPGSRSAPFPALVPISGGEFQMGDIFDEGHDREKPVHHVKLSGFFLAAHEVTVAEFRRFVNETGYQTSAEQNPDPEAHQRLLAVIQDQARTAGERRQAYLEMLSHAGCFRYDPDNGSWKLDDSGASWRAPGFAQAQDHPVTCISWNDAIHYCNWMSRNAGLAPAYDEASGRLLDAAGNATIDITKVVGYRLPTEAEWEYAAREGGQQIRFGNGKSAARSDEINFDAASGELPYLEKGELRGHTTSVGSFAPNGLGLFDMAGNVWEWCSDWYQGYDSEPSVNPYVVEGSRRAARGGRWGGDASEARTTARFAWEPNNRCNNIGFRVALSKPE
jgi:formylglycine-generating enzyme required for sulfatase activity